MRRRDFLTVPVGIAWPVVARAQQPRKVYRIAFVHPASPVSRLTEEGDFRTLFTELRRLGYAEGQNLAVERYSAEGQAHRFSDLAEQAVASKPDLIITLSRRMVEQLKNATASIPIIAGGTIDPVGHGIAASLARPGGNITGFTTDVGLEVLAKHIELLRHAVPDASRIAWLAPEESWSARYGQQMQETAHRTGIKLLGPSLISPIRETEYRRVFAVMAEQRADALVVGDVTDNHTFAKLIVELAQTHRLPAIYPERWYVDHGGLMAYAHDREDRWRRVADYVDRVLKGESPGGLPFQQPTKFELVINLKTANALGLTIPPTLLARADEVIE